MIDVVEYKGILGIKIRPTNKTLTLNWKNFLNTIQKQGENVLFNT